MSNQQMSKHQQLWAQGLCSASKPHKTDDGVVVLYCTKPRETHSQTGEDHSDGTHVWPCAFESYGAAKLEKLLREPQTRVRDWKGDPKRDPRLVADVSKFFVAPPSSKR